jgi:nucleotide-binding universal stress UspA family protein
MAMEDNGSRDALITAGAAVEDRIELPADDARPFGSVLCAIEGSADPGTAQRQAVLLAIVAPRVLGEQSPPERTIPRAAAQLNASLVVLESGSSRRERSVAARIAGAIGRSVLVIPRDVV